MATGPDIFSTAEEKAAFDAVASRAKMTRYGGDCYAYCMLASGFVDLVVESGLEPYDIQALVPLIENAGGYVANWRGESSIESGQVIAAGTAALLNETVELLSQASAD